MTAFSTDHGARSHLGQIQSRLAANAIDLDHVTILRSELGEDEFIDLAAVFIAELKKDLSALSADPNIATARAFHALRGAASNLGLTSFCEYCHRLEHREGLATQADLDSLSRLLSTGLAALAHHIPQLGAEI